MRTTIAPPARAVLIVKSPDQSPLVVMTAHHIRFHLDIAQARRHHRRIQ
jgi:hypothetical protein